MLDSTVLDRIEDREDVLDGRIALHIVDGVADEAAVPVEEVDALAHLAIHVLRRLIHRVLGVDAATPEGDVLAKVSFELNGVHAARGALDGIQNIEAGFDELRDERRNGAAGMNEDFPIRVAVDEFVEPGFCRMSVSKK